MISNLKQAALEIENSRTEIINRLAEFADTDTLLFWSPKEDLKTEQEKIWTPYLQWFGKKIGADMNPTDSINVEGKNIDGIEKMKECFFALSTAELTSLYFAAAELNSVILGLYFATENADIQSIIDAAFLEEKFQAKRWGENLPAEEKYKEIAKNLEALRHTFVQ